MVTSARDHVGARRVLEAVWPGRTRTEYQAAQAVALQESGYGYGFTAAARAGIINWGATQRGVADAEGRCPAGQFPYPDSNDDGPYMGCMFGYGSHEDAARAFLRTLTGARSTPARVGPDIGRALRSGSLVELARAMWCRGYFTGQKGATPPRRADLYAAWLNNSARNIGAALGEGQLVQLDRPASAFKWLVTAGGALALPWTARGPGLTWQSEPARKGGQMTQDPNPKKKPRRRGGGLGSFVVLGGLALAARKAYDRA